MHSNDKVETRIKELKAEWNKGQQQLSCLEQKKKDIKNMLFRIDGAIKVLQELLDDKTEDNSELSQTESSANRASNLVSSN